MGHHDQLRRIERSGAPTALHVEVAATFKQRLIGLLNAPPLPPDRGLWIHPCGRVHTVGMRWPIDVVMLDPEGTILSLQENLSPWRLGPAGHRAGAALELAAGGIRKYALTLGDQLTLGDP